MPCFCPTHLVRIWNMAVRVKPRTDRAQPITLIMPKAFIISGLERKLCKEQHVFVLKKTLIHLNFTHSEYRNVHFEVSDGLIET